MSEFRHTLLARYREIGLSPPDWAYQLPPSIPLIGSEYGKKPRMLVYGSAENLSHYERKPETVPDYLKDDRALDRHRATFEYAPGSRFFPHVHMAPFENGSLLVATSFYLWKSVRSCFEKPIELLECIAAANFCKFAIAGSVNKDHVGNRDKVDVSLDYVVADLQVLQPCVCILPKTLLNHASVRRRLNSAAPNVQWIALPQFNSQVVNIHLQKHSDAATRLADQLQDHPIAEWVDAMPGYKAGYPYRYLVEMEQEIDSMEF